jgi:hypothetical protein
MTLHLLFIGRPRDAHANALAQEYIKRSSRFLACRMAEIDPRRFDLFQRHPAALTVFLDPAGGQFTSAQFQGLVESTRLEARDLVFLVGGHDGLPTGMAFARGYPAVTDTVDAAPRTGTGRAGRTDLPGPGGDEQSPLWALTAGNQAESASEGMHEASAPAQMAK